MMRSIYLKYIAYLILLFGACRLPLYAQYDTTGVYFHHSYALDSLRVFNGGAFENHNNYLIIGNETKAGYYQLNIRALDKKGNYLWKKTLKTDTLNMASYYDKQCLDLEDSTYIITAELYKKNGLRNIIILKVNNFGNIIWEKEIGKSDWSEHIDMIHKVKDGGFILVGQCASYEQNKGGIYVLKIDNEGIMEWEQCYFTTYWDIALSVCESSDGGYLLSGIHSKVVDPPIQLNKMFVMKIDYFGNEVWTVYPEDNDKAQSGCTITPIPTTDGSLPNTYLLVAKGGGFDYTPYGQLYFAKIDEQGNLFEEAIKPVSNVYSFQSTVHFINPTTFVGRGLEKQPFFANSNVQGNLMCFDTDYNLLWRKGYCTNKERDHYTRGMLPTQDGGYLLTGLSMEGYAWELKVDSLGNTCWFNAPPQWEQATDPEGNTYYTAGCDSIYIEVLGIEEIGTQGGVSISPNPATEQLRLLPATFGNRQQTTLTYTLSIADVQGRQMYFKSHIDANGEIIDVSQWANGTYIATLRSDDGKAEHHKISVLHH